MNISLPRFVGGARKPHISNRKYRQRSATGNINPARPDSSDVILYNNLEELGVEQRLVVRDVIQGVLSTDNQPGYFITGAAGTGTLHIGLKPTYQAFLCTRRVYLSCRKNCNSKRDM
jgi:hypothetical protein